MQPLPHPSDATHKIWSRLASWLQRCTGLKVWMTTDADAPLLYYKLTLRAFGSGELKKKFFWSKEYVNTTHVLLTDGLLSGQDKRLFFCGPLGQDEPCLSQYSKELPFFCTRLVDAIQSEMLIPKWSHITRKPVFRVLRPGRTKTSLLSHRSWPVSWNSEYRI